MNRRPADRKRLRAIAESAKVGCCGFSVARPKYFREFTVVEIQQTFYNLPRLATAEKWRAEAPPGFEFPVKAWQLITHEPTSPTYRRLRKPIEKTKQRLYGGFRPTDEVLAAWQATLEFVRRLGADNVIFQCPASFRPTSENKRNIRQFFSSIDRSGITCVWEPRGEWGEEEIRDICEACSLVHCVDPFRSRPQAGAIRYFRLHGISGYRYRYTDADLETLLNGLDPRLPTYLLFNNLSMFDDALRLKRLLGRIRK